MPNDRAPGIAGPARHLHRRRLPRRDPPWTNCATPSLAAPTIHPRPVEPEPSMRQARASQAHKQPTREMRRESAHAESRLHDRVGAVVPRAKT